MEYVEILRARRVLFWFGAVLAAGLIITAVAWFFGHGHNQNEGTERFSSLVGVASFAAIIIATLMVSGLSAESANTTALIWTRPAPRDAIAWRFVAVDLVTVVIGYVVMIVAMLIGLGIVGSLGSITFDAALTLRAVALGLGGAAMWYAVVSAAAARLPGRGPLLAGLSWGLFPILTGLIGAHFPIWLHDVIVVLNYANPVAWLGGMTAQDHGGFVPLSPWMRVAGEWLIALVAVAASVRLWSTREV